MNGTTVLFILMVCFVLWIIVSVIIEKRNFNIDIGDGASLRPYLESTGCKEKRKFYVFLKTSSFHYDACIKDRHRLVLAWEEVKVIRKGEKTPYYEHLMSLCEKEKDRLIEVERPPEYYKRQKQRFNTQASRQEKLFKVRTSFYNNSQPKPETKQKTTSTNTSDFKGYDPNDVTNSFSRKTQTDILFSKMPEKGDIIEWANVLTELIKEKNNIQDRITFGKAINIMRRSAPEYIIKKLNFLQIIRNGYAHETGYADIVDQKLDDYVNTAKEVWYFLNRNNS